MRTYLSNSFFFAAATAIIGYGYQSQFGVTNASGTSTAVRPEPLDYHNRGCPLDIVQLIDALTTHASDKYTILRSESEPILQFLNENPRHRMALGVSGMFDRKDVVLTEGSEVSPASTPVDGTLSPPNKSLFFAPFGSASSEYREVFNRLRSFQSKDGYPGIAQLFSTALSTEGFSWREDPDVRKVILIVTDSIDGNPNNSLYEKIGKTLRDNNVVPVFVLAPAAEYCGPGLSQICGSAELQEYAARTGDPSLSDPLIGVHHFYRNALEHMNVTGFVVPVDMQFTGFSRAFFTIVQAVTETLCVLSDDNLDNNPSSSETFSVSREEVSDNFSHRTNPILAPLEQRTSAPQRDSSIEAKDALMHRFPFVFKFVTSLYRSPATVPEAATTDPPKSEIQVTARRLLRHSLPASR